MKKYLKIKIVKNDNLEEAFGAYKEGSFKDDEAVIILNVYTTLLASVENNLDFKEFIIETMMHEFGHCLEEVFEKDFDEEFIQRITQTYIDKYGKK